jgi:hypothetical protein
LHSGRYVRVPSRALDLLRTLVSDAGKTVRETRTKFPDVDIERLVELGALVYVPPEGLPVDHRLVAECAARNMHARWALRRGPNILLRATAAPYGHGPATRPLFFDEVEAATRQALAIPGTSAVCTVVALATYELLRDRGYPTRVLLLAEPEQVLAHAAACVGRHRIEPGTSDLALVPLDVLQPLSKSVRSHEPRSPLTEG